jgi:hypothetical protein
MPRQPIPAAEITGHDLVTQSPPDVMDQTSQLAAAQRELVEVAIQQPFTVEHRVTLYLAAAQQCGLALLTMGACLCDLKEHISQGEWLSTLEQLGITARTAQRQMQIWRTFGKENRQPFAIGKRANLLLELSRLDDETLDSALESGELDELDRLPPAELKQRIRALKQDLDAANEIVEAKDRKINELDRKARTWSRTAPAEQAIEILKDGSLALADVAAASGRLEAALVAALDAVGPDVPAEVLKRVFELKDQADACIASISARLAAYQGD